ncbi:MAG: MBL fold metallo-hydrolase [Alphaproteobacteria bacterium]
MKLTFLGGVGTVTGSKFVLDAPQQRIMIDCGLFQGFKQLRLRNWEKLPIDPARIDSVVITHAHLDHSGYLPLLVRNGFKGRVHVTEATADLLKILLTDSAYLAEREADYANRRGFSKHKPALPLYTQKDVEAALDRLTPVDFDQKVALGDGITLRLRPAGHILGAAIAEIMAGGRTIVFSGDLGRTGDAIMHDPARITDADVLLVESTYGDRAHIDDDPEDALADLIARTSARGGTVLIPAFAVGRTQTLLYYLHRLKQAGRIPNLPIFLDSPMAMDATDIFCRHPADHRLPEDKACAACAVARYVRTVEDSKALDHNSMPRIIISASGMATGGRIVHHLKHYASDPRSTILFAGFQAGGTRGAAMVAGADEIKIHGAYVPVKAEVAHLDMLSAHADADGIIDWLKAFKRPPQHTYVVHGEPAGADALRHRIEEELGWTCSVPEYRDTVEVR